MEQETIIRTDKRTGEKIICLPDGSPVLTEKDPERVEGGIKAARTRKKNEEAAARMGQAEAESAMEVKAEE